VRLRFLRAGVLSALVAIPVCWLPVRASATILTEEFTGYSDGALTGNNGGTGPWSGAWATPGNSVQVNTTSGGLGAVSTISSTDPIAQATLSGPEQVSTRSFTTISGQSNVYFHVLLNITQSGSGEGGVLFFNGGSDEQFFFGKNNSGNPNWGITARPGTGFDSGNSSVPVPSGTTTLLVGKIDQVNNVAKLWVNPDLTLLENQNAPVFTLNFGSGNDDIDTVRLRAAGTAGDVWKYDNLAIFSSGDSPFATAAVPEPGLATLLTLGGAMIYWRRRAILRNGTASHPPAGY
jgi:hypothetical protein